METSIERLKRCSYGLGDNQKKFVLICCPPSSSQDHPKLESLELEMSVNEELQLKSYWDKRYQQEKEDEEFDWFRKYSDIKSVSLPSL